MDTMIRWKYGNKYTFIDLKDQEQLSTIEKLGKIFKLDDSKIYTLTEYNKKLISAIDRIELKKTKNIENLRSKLNQQQRIKFIYKTINHNKEKEINILKKIFYKEYLCAMYIYDITKKM